MVLRPLVSFVSQTSQNGRPAAILCLSLLGVEGAVGGEGRDNTYPLAALGGLDGAQPWPQSPWAWQQRYLGKAIREPRPLTQPHRPLTQTSRQADGDAATGSPEEL